MSGSKTQYSVQAVLNQILGGVQFTPPATVYFALSTAAFDATATGANMSEVDESGYARVAMANNGAHWSTADNAYPSTKFNVGDIVFATATHDWADQPQSVYVADAITGGNLLYGADLSSAATVQSGESFKINAGTFIFQEN